jgi:hypothetical protein
VWPGNYYTNLSPLEDEPPMKALFLGTLAASQATAIIEFITADVRTEILDNNEPEQATTALADADVLLTGAWRSGFPAAPKLRLLQVPLAGTDGIDEPTRRLAGRRWTPWDIAAIRFAVSGSLLLPYTIRKRLTLETPGARELRCLGSIRL